MTDTYHRSVQIDASRIRYQDAKSLQKSGRWSGAIYLAGYAIECSLKALICYEERKTNIKDTKMFKERGIQGAALHNLGALYEASRELDLILRLDRTGKLKSAWGTVVNLWNMEELRYGRAMGYQKDCDRFLEAVELLYPAILRRQKEHV